MRTSLSLLPAINSLYDIGLTAKQIRDIKQQCDSIENILVNNDNLSYHNSIRNGFRYIIKTPGILVEAFPFTPDATVGKIEIEKIEKDKKNNNQLRTKAISDLNEGEGVFTFNSERYGARDKILTFKTVNNTTVKLLDKFIATSKVFLVGDIRTYNTDLENVFFNTIFNNTKEFETILRNYFDTVLNLENYIPMIKGNSTDEVTKSRKLVNYFLPETIKTNSATLQSMLDTVGRHDNVNGILSVWEQSNTRYVLFIKGTNYNYNGTPTYLIRADHMHPAYNYLDVDRYTAFHGNSDVVSATKGQEFGTIIFADLLPTIPVKEVLNSSLSDLAQTTEDESFSLPNNATLRLLTKRFDQRQSRKKKEATAKESLEKKIQKKIDILKDLDDPKAELKINNVRFTPSQVEYEGQILSFDTDETWVYTMIKHLIYRWSFNDINFDMVFDEFLSRAKRYPNGMVGEVTFTVEQRYNTNVNGVESVLTYINDCRINAGELEACIRRGLCYQTQPDFDFFLKSVSTCSLELHEYLDLGIQLNLHDYFENVTIKAKLPLERTKNINYLVLGDKQYRVRNTQRLIRLEKQNELLEAVSTLLNPDVVTGIQPEDIKDLIVDAKEEYVSAVEKSKKLLTETEATFKIKADHATLGNGDRKYGYIIKGQMRKYFIELHERDIEKSSCRVYDYRTGDYFCIVDKGTNTQVGMDKLVNRIFALHNDSLLAPQIYTLNRN